MKKVVSVLFFVVAIIPLLQGQQVYPLYNSVIPNSKPNTVKEQSRINESDGAFIITGITVPTIEVYLPLPQKNTGASVIIFPGGGYYVNAYKHEGTAVAKEFQKMGIAAFVVKYRLPDSLTMLNPSIGALQDAQRAVQWVRLKAAEYKLNIHKVGVLGFSAGGHLAASCGTMYENSLIENEQQLNLRPDFMLLVYPVISLSSVYSPAYLIDKLLGKAAPDSLRNAWSPEKLITQNTPPCFLVHAANDEGVQPRHSIEMFENLNAQQIPAELHIYAKGGHGFGLKLPNSKEQWIQRCVNWMTQMGFMNKKS